MAKRRYTRAHAHAGVARDVVEIRLKTLGGEQFAGSFEHALTVALRVLAQRPLRRLGGTHPAECNADNMKAD